MKPEISRSPESVIRENKRKTCRKFNPEEKIRIILEGLKGEENIAAICRREGITPNLLNYKWNKSFLEAGTQRLKGDTMREADSDEVGEPRKENGQLKQLVAELSLKNLNQIQTTASIRIIFCQFLQFTIYLEEEMDYGGLNKKSSSARYGEFGCSDCLTSCSMWV